MEVAEFYDQDGNTIRYGDQGERIRGMVVTATLNPITRSVVQLDPPLDVCDMDAFRPAFNAFCDAAWTLPTRRDPQGVNPHRVIDGTEPVDTLTDAVTRVVTEYGPYAVEQAVAAAREEYWKLSGGEYVIGGIPG